MAFGEAGGCFGEGLQLQTEKQDKEASFRKKYYRHGWEKLHEQAKVGAAQRNGKKQYQIGPSNWRASAAEGMLKELGSSRPSDKRDNASIDIKMKRAVTSSENDRNQRSGCKARYIVRSYLKDWYFNASQRKE